MPPLPFYHGQMRLPGEAPIAILSASSGAAHQAVHPGETIGPFKLVEVNSQELAFEWQDKTVRKRLDELIDRSAPAAPAPAAAASAAAKAAAAAVPAQPATKAGPGQNINPEVKACLPNDSYEDGAVVDGYQKTVRGSPFGVQCQWVKAN